MSSGSGGGSGGGSRKWAVSISRDENYEKHNPNSPMRVDLSSVEKRQMKIEKLRIAGVSKEQLKVVYPVPEDKLRQGPAIDPLVTESSGLVSMWAAYRVNYFYTKVFGEGSPQDDRDMEGFITHIETKIKPRLREIQAEIRELVGDPLMPPAFFNIPLKNVDMPAKPRRK